VAADVVKTYRDDWNAYRDKPPDRTDRYRMSLETQCGRWEHALFVRNAELAKAENRKLDALAYYSSAVRTAMSADYARDKVLPDASALWRELGGTPEGWQQWLDHAAVPPPAASPKTEIAKAAAWTKVDRKFPAFRVGDLNGGNRTHDDLKGAVTLVNVWATWCEPCRVELPALQKLHDRLRESGAARVITLNTDVSTGLVGPFVAEHKYTFPVWLAQPVFDELKPMGGIPANWIVDSEGVIRWESIGFSRGKDDEWIKAMLAKLEEVR
jgi:thiol-disulfide isomerase/thioredoxin